MASQELHRTVLSDEEQSVLSRWARWRETAQARRAQIVLAYMEAPTATLISSGEPT